MNPNDVAPAVTFEIFSAFLVAKKVQTTCEVCKQGSGWIARGTGAGDGNGSPIEGLSYLMIDKSGRVQHTAASGFPTLSLECSHCGHLRLFNHRTVLDWSQRTDDASAGHQKEPSDATEE